MRSVFTLLLTALGLSLVLMSCENCGPSREPFLNLSLQLPTPAKVDTIYALDARNPLPKQDLSTSAVTSALWLELPLNLNANQSRYVFQLNGRRDTVTVFYRRSFAYRNQRCGYVLDLYQPDGTPARTTRGTISNVSYWQNRDGSFPGGSQQTHIELFIRL
ncbi:hypothetical protein Slin_6316 [Spirosoma linguale DSM 74]|uniref:Lipoprotein n=1 Tax=Spirosoma linguale (strain ATCC 33905 / DSM 74 / LMG 10896 / Claus 1) TaxID=504472 RepID=D2QTZ3_SPILD|nr:hypothetical protein Slin_6316 [Spirosoma linguale DSM 74]